jgi:hypothetical protein
MELCFSFCFQNEDTKNERFIFGVILPEFCLSFDKVLVKMKEKWRNLKENVRKVCNVFLHISDANIQIIE